MTPQLQQLIADTLSWVKSGACPKEALIATKEEWKLFEPHSPQVPATTPAPHLVKPVITPIPDTPSPHTVKPEVSKTVEPQPTHSPEAVQKAAPPSVPNSQHIRQVLSQVAPHLRLVDTVLDDTPGKQLATAWQEKISDAAVILLACTEDEETIHFLKMLAKAIDTRLERTKILPTARLEKENRWEAFLSANHFRLIIASEGLHKLPRLASLYRKQEEEEWLNNTPLFCLSSAALYNKQIETKALLWKRLCQKLTQK